MNQKFEISNTNSHPVPADEQRRREQVFEGANTREMLDHMNLVDAVNAKNAPTEVDTEFNENRAGNIYDTVAAADTPEHPQESAEYQEAEGFDEQMLAAESLAEAIHARTQSKSEGVTAHADGTVTLSANGRADRFTAQGVPVVRPTEPPRA